MSVLGFMHNEIHLSNKTASHWLACWCKNFCNHRPLKKMEITLNLDPIDENLDDLFDDLVVSSGSGGKSPATKGHLEALNKSWCSGTT